MAISLVLKRVTALRHCYAVANALMTESPDEMNENPGMAASNIHMFENESTRDEIPKGYSCSAGRLVGSIGSARLKPKQTLVLLNHYAFVRLTCTPLRMMPTRRLC